MMVFEDQNQEKLTAMGIQGYRKVFEECILMGLIDLGILDCMKVVGESLEEWVAMEIRGCKMENYRKEGQEDNMKVAEKDCMKEYLMGNLKVAEEDQMLGEWAQRLRGMVEKGTQAVWVGLKDQVVEFLQVVLLMLLGVHSFEEQVLVPDQTKSSLSQILDNIFDSQQFTNFHLHLQSRRKGSSCRQLRRGITLAQFFSSNQEQTNLSIFQFISIMFQKKVNVFKDFFQIDSSYLITLI